MFVVIRDVEEGCEGEHTVTLVFATENEQLARDWVASATVELEAARAAFSSRWHNLNQEINKSNYRDWMKAALVLDKGYFYEKDDNLEEVYNVSYSIETVEVR